MTKNSLKTIRHKINILKQNISTKVTTESQKSGLNSTKVNTKYTKELSAFNIIF